MILEQTKLKFIFNLRNANVTDKTVLNIMEEVSRDHFIRNSFNSYALEDISLPIECGQTTTQPSIIGLMVQALEVTARCKILEIGTGSGYQTAILAKLGRRVYSIERFKKLTNLARQAITELSLANVTIIYGDGTMGLPEQAPFDRIILSASVEDIPSTLLQQLKEDGVLVAPVGERELLQTMVRVKKKNNSYEYKELKQVKFLPIIEGKELVKLDRSRNS
jgi:protein-L-isoaspartate(D-aspartate) O-methyltransferase